MRSRYAAYAVGDVGHLVRTWHPRTRPEPLALDPARAWTGLTVLDVVGGGPGEETGEVEFEAVFEHAGTPGRQYERSRSQRRRAYPSPVRARTATAPMSAGSIVATGTPANGSRTVSPRLSWSAQVKGFDMNPLGRSAVQARPLSRTAASDTRL